MNMTVRDYNRHVAEQLRREHPVVKVARCEVGVLNRLQHEAYLAKAKLDNQKIVVARALREMAACGAPDEPWAEHWRRALDVAGPTP